jgi:raffinose/stachyose/melibiose transport system substrate-binding protein
VQVRHEAFGQHGPPARLHSARAPGSVSDRTTTGRPGNIGGNMDLLSRRKLLQMGAGAMAAAGVAPLLGSPFTAGAARGQELPTGQNLDLWWWGEQEAPGLEGWLDESLRLYQERSGNTIESTLQDTSVVISEFQTASAAGAAPDLQFFWNGIYHMESVWFGYVEPLNGLLPADLLAASNATSLSVYQGNQYRVGWYAVPLLWVYNKALFDQAGLDADKPPATWDELMAACEALKTAGITPMSGGLKDGPWGEWYMGHATGQNLDSPADALNLFIGSLDWREPRYYEGWSRLADLWNAGYLNDDMNSIDLYPGIDLFSAGQAAMTQIVGPLVPNAQSQLGAENVGAMVMPVFGSGAMAGKPIFDTQGLGISSQSQNKEVAADFLAFLHSEERVNELWNQVQQFPTNADWDGSVVTDPTLRDIWQTWVNGEERVPYISNLMPTLFWTDAMFVNSQKIISGEFTGEQAGENAYQVTQKWREQNPDLLENYTTWAEDLAL